MQHDLECGLPVMPSRDSIGVQRQAVILETPYSATLSTTGLNCADIRVGVSPFYLCWRKSLDITFGIIGMAILFLIFPILALLIYLDSPGPLFYCQERLGLHGKPFRMYKFRSMRVDAERAGHAVWARVRDPRVTRVGRFMRAIHLDELPQVFNILRGEMCLIGPRPEREAFAAQLASTVP
ncbi:MAG: sugar transferase, partial [Chloroflexi bacterium]|nr:sugar transferase [Chloroflexota bacterium]